MASSCRFSAFSCCASFSFSDARSLASPAFWSASPALLERNEKSSSLAFRMRVSTVSILDSKDSSPVTPIATKAAPNNPRANRNLFGLSGGCTTPRLKSCSSSTYPQTTNTTSMTTPATTNNVQTSNQEWSAVLDASRLVSSVLSADSSTLNNPRSHAWRIHARAPSPGARQSSGPPTDVIPLRRAISPFGFDRGQSRTRWASGRPSRCCREGRSSA